MTGTGFNSSPACNTQTGVGCLQPGQSYTHTFNAAGSYDYHCNVHPNMMGTVVVQAAAPATTATTAPPTTKAAAPAPTTPTTHPATTTTTGPAATTTTAPATTTSTRATTTSTASSVPSPTVQLAAPAGHHGSGSAAVAVGLGLAALATVGGIVALVRARRRSL